MRNYIQQKNNIFNFKTYLKPHPFPLLLYLEWILLVITIIGQFPPFFGGFAPLPRFLLLPIGDNNAFLSYLLIVMLGLTGLHLPQGKLLPKIIYIAFTFTIAILQSTVAFRGVGFFPSLLLILVIRSSILFNLTGRIITGILTYLFFLYKVFSSLNNVNFSPPPHQPRRLPPSPEKVTEIIRHLSLHSSILFGLVLVFVLLLVHALLAERQSREKLALAHEQLQEYAQKIENQATLQERNRIAREIHDSLGHNLTAQSIQLENALVYLPTDIDKAIAFLKEGKSLGTKALLEVRQSVATLRSNPLQGKSLESAINSLIADFQRQTGIIPNYKISIDTTLTQEVNATTYRIIQEALTNIAKHSLADNVKINIQTSLDSLYLQIEDNGKGFNPKQNTTGFGLQGMRERCQSLSGKLHIISSPGEGCRITAFFPLTRLNKQVGK
jgi:signal transduction histidine kinase